MIRVGDDVIISGKIIEVIDNGPCLDIYRVKLNSGCESYVTDEDIKSKREEKPNEEYDKEYYKKVITALEAENKTLRIKLDNAEDVLRGLKEDLTNAREELRERW